MIALRIKISEDVRPLEVFLAYATASGVVVDGRGEDMESYIKKTVLSLQERFSPLRRVGEDPTARALRKFYWRIGIDPTKIRPSSEALVRRIVGKGAFPRINNVVDAINLASAETLVPIGLYDIDKVEGDVQMRRAREGEVFIPIGGKEISLAGGEPVLADSQKIMFLYPYRDSELTKVDESTKEVLIVGAGVPGIERPLVRRAVNLSIELLERFCSGRRNSETIEVG